MIMIIIIIIIVTITITIIFIIIIINSTVPIAENMKAACYKIQRAVIDWVEFSGTFYCNIPLANIGGLNVLGHVARCCLNITI